MDYGYKMRRKRSGESKSGKMKNAKIKFPQVVFADDYHEFNYLQRVLRSFGVKYLKFQEVGMTRGKYVAVFYLQKQDDAFRSLYKAWSDKIYDEEMGIVNENKMY